MHHRKVWAMHILEKNVKLGERRRKKKEKEKGTVNNKYLFRTPNLWIELETKLFIREVFFCAKNRKI